MLMLCSKPLYVCMLGRFPYSSHCVCLSTCVHGLPQHVGGAAHDFCEHTCAYQCRTLHTHSRGVCAAGVGRVGKWQELHDLVEVAWPRASSEQQRAAAKMACSAAAGLGVWEAIETYLPALSDDDADGSLYGAMVAVVRNDFAAASQLIVRARQQLQPALTSLWQESYTRAHDPMVKVQMVAELEEVGWVVAFWKRVLAVVSIVAEASFCFARRLQVIMYKQAADDEATKAHIRRTWEKRLLGCQYHIDVWLPVLTVRTLVLAPVQDLGVWLKFCSLCRHQGEATGARALGLERARSNLVMLLGCDPRTQPQYVLPTTHPAVTYAYIKFMWENAEKDAAVQQLYRLIDFLGAGPGSVGGTVDDTDHHELLARCYHKLGQWRARPFLESAGQMSLAITDEGISSILESFHLATLYNRDWYKAWHAWAFMSFEAVTYYERTDNPAQRLTHAAMAVTGFFNSIGLCDRSNLQDTLRLLTLWFKYGGHPEVAAAIAAGVSSVSINTWLQVIPQLIARIQVADPQLRESIHSILLQVCPVHVGVDMRVCRCACVRG